MWRAPGDSPALDDECRKRSPLTYLENAKDVNLHINAGIRDGHDGSVPVSHSLNAFNKVAKSKDRLADKDITYFVEEALVPPHLQMDISAPSYGQYQPLFRRT